MEETIGLDCPHCGKGLRVLMSQAADIVECPHCRARVDVGVSLSAGREKPPPSRRKERSGGGLRFHPLFVVGLAVLAGAVVTSVSLSHRRQASGTATNEAQRANHVALGDRTQPIWERPEDYWEAWGEANGFEREPYITDFYSASKEGGHPRIRVVYEDGVLQEVFVMDASEPHSAGVESVFGMWETIDPGMAERFRELRASRAVADTPLHRIGDEYAYGWSETNKAYVKRVGTRAQHKELATVHAEVAELELVWFDMVQQARDRFGERYDKEPTKGIEFLRLEVLELEWRFKDMRSVDRPERWTRKQSMYQFELWSQWPDAVKEKLMLAAGRCYEISRRVRSQLDRKEAPDCLVFNELEFAIYEGGGSARSSVFGDMQRLVEHDEVAALPPELESRLESIALSILAKLRQSRESRGGGKD